ncbi:MAG: rod shape-determining protein MreC [Thermoleophilia bacterium]
MPPPQVVATGVARRRAIIRRGVVSGLAVLCLVIFTGYFRESPGGPLHDVQATSASVVGPVQDVATKAVQPFRDAWGWVTSLRDARDRAERLQAENDVLRAENAANQVDRAMLDELQRQTGVTELGTQGYRKVRAPIIARSPTAWYRTAVVDIGDTPGVVEQSPVVAGGARGAGLVGVVTRVAGSKATVAFITDGQTEVGGMIPDASRAIGLLQSIGPGELRMSGVPKAAAVETGQSVVTGGFDSARLPNPYPPGIPVGVVTSVGRQDVDLDWTVQVTPMVDTGQISSVVVLVPESARAKRRAAG